MEDYFRYSIRIFFIFFAFDLVGAALDNETISAYCSLAVVCSSWLIALTGVVKYNLLNDDRLPLFGKTIFAIFLALCLINVARSVELPLNTPKSIPRYLGGVLYTPAWMVPVFILYGGNIKVWKEAWSIGLLFAKLFIWITPLYLFFRSRNKLFFSNYHILIQFIPLFMINWHLIAKKYKIIIVGGFLIACLFSVLNSERNFFARLFFYPIAYYGFIFFNKVPDKLSSFYKLSFGLLIIGASFLLLYNGYVSKYISDPFIRENVETFEKGNLNSDSRKMVYEDFFADFKRPEDFLFGRGVLGTTFSEQFITIQIVRGIEENIFRLPLGHRTEVEGGYLMYILKVGLVGLFLMLALALGGLMLAFFQSNNYFVKATGIIIIEWLINMYPYGIPEYNFSNILFWLSIGCCLSKEMRSYSNEDILSFFGEIKMAEIFKGVRII
ncbi:MAG TPA: hypothetical protein VM935_11395 [Chitinophagaceae bacterium]|nr:hypothetical protein [Chitinophagaceae bacterium]